MDYINKILCGNDLEILPKLPAESVNCCVTSPPYWSLRDYGIDPVIWDGDKKFYSESLKRCIPMNCKHEWGNKTTTLKHKSGETNPGKESWFKDKGASDDKGNCFCIKCGAWRGSLGLEPTFELYIKHLCDIFDEVKRVLRKDGTCWVNIGDSYGGSGGASGHTLETSNLNRLTIGYGATEGNQKMTKGYSKSLLDIPYRFSIEMTNRGWIKRNTIIWWKLNCMPSSANDRFTIDFEYLFFFTKNNKAIFWTNEKTLECVDKKPLGVKGIEDKDWEWRSCPACSNKNYFNYRTRDIMRKEKGCPQFKASDEEKKNIKNKICPRCKGLKKVKYSFWSGHDYWFEQQFEEYAPDTLPRMERGVNVNKWTFGANGQTPHNLSQPRLNKKRGYKTKQPEEEIHRPQHHGKDISYGKQGRNKRCVWVIATQPFPEAHFAVYPEGLIDIPIKAGCPEFICKKCGKARVKMYKYKGGTIGKSWHDHSKDLEEGMHQSLGGLDKQGDKPYQRIEVGYTDCGCNAGFEPGIVLDPFMGAGTSALVALKQRKRFIGIEIKQSYIDMSYKRIARVQQRIF